MRATGTCYKLPARAKCRKYSDPEPAGTATALALREGAPVAGVPVSFHGANGRVISTGATGPDRRSADILAPSGIRAGIFCSVELGGRPLALCILDRTRKDTNPEIAMALGSSVHTIRNQVKSIFRKAGASTRAELVGIIKRSRRDPRLTRRRRGARSARIQADVAS